MLSCVLASPAPAPEPTHADVAVNGEFRGDVDINVTSSGGDVAVNGDICKPTCQTINVAPCPPPPPPLDPCTHGQCHWDGTAPSCEGSCSGHTMQCGNSRSGDGESCWSGSKAYCCSIPQVPDYHCEVRVVASCGCGNNMINVNCDNFRARKCDLINQDECSAYLDAFQLAGGADACARSVVSAAHSTFPRLMLIILLMSLFFLPGLGSDVTWNVNVDSGGGQVAVNGDVCNVQCDFDSESEISTSLSSSDSSGGTSSESSSAAEGSYSPAPAPLPRGGDTTKSGGRRLQSESFSKSKSKMSAMCGCGNEKVEIDCELYQNKQCRMSNQQSQSTSESGVQVGSGPKINAEISQTVGPENNQACEESLKAFGSDENRVQTCVNQGPGAVSVAARAWARLFIVVLGAVSVS